MEKKNSVLIVDDDPSSLTELAHILQPEYKIYTVKDGISALEKASEHLPDIILLDIFMPDMDGFEVNAKLKQTDKTKDIPVIFITGAVKSGDEVKGLAAGAVDYIRKPFSDMIVKLRVRHQIQLLNQLRKIENLSMKDQLTNLSNRRCFEIRINEEWTRALREKTPISILMIDIDWFKNYNDNYGHQQGDIALQAVASVFDKALKRSGDYAARWGGEEFTVLLSNTDASGAYDVGQKIRKLIENLEISGPDELKTKITVSIGVNTQLYGPAGTIGDFIAGADIALYDAKNKGRNRVCNHINP